MIRSEFTVRTGPTIAYAPLVRLAATVPSPDARAAQPGESAADTATRAALP